MSRGSDGVLYKGRIPIKVTVPLVLYGAVGVFSLLYVYNPEWRDALKFIGAAVGVATALQSVFFARRALEHNVLDRQMHVACEYFWKYYGPELKDLRTRYSDIRAEIKGKSATQVIGILDDSVKKLDVAGICNFWEAVGYSARRGRVEVEMLSALMKTAAVNIFEDLQPWLEEHRRASKQPTAWENFQWLYHELKK